MNGAFERRSREPVNARPHAGGRAGQNGAFERRRREPVNARPPMKISEHVGAKFGTDEDVIAHGF